MCHRNQCIAVIGDTINPDEYPLQDGINYLRDSMATLRWMAWEEKRPVIVGCI